MSEQTSNDIDPLKKRLIAAFPGAGEFIWEELGSDKKREEFLRSEGLLGEKAVKEALPDSNLELERERGLQQLVEQYFPEDLDFLVDMDEEDKLSYVYGRLLETGEDPDGVLHDFGVIEGGEDEV